ncbi:glutathione ABC transporter substrate-binding protein [Corticicoccus populi]|uniref:Glutathione ABC transporter substrate-binding protein n=1 Tax=Corticicoccus populi TaxID=1812821 RepID=A0ABW5WX03_9STAP
MKQRRYWFFSAIVVVMLFLQACSTGGNDNGSTSEEENTENEGGTLRIVTMSDATSLDPQFITNIPSANFIYQKVYENLVTFDEDMEIVPNLASEWEQLDDVTWEFTLEEGITFHDGEPFNAEAVKVTLDRLLDPETGSPQRDKVSMIKEVVVVDDTTVQLILNEPYAPLLSILASQETSILSPKSVQENPDSLSDTPVGTGPFVFESWNSGQSISLSKNEDYWGEPAKVDEVIFEITPESTTRLAMVETGEAHISDNVPVTELNRVESSDQVNLIQREGLGVEYIGFNTGQTPFDDVNLRKAVSHAIEREAIINGIYEGTGTVATSAMSPSVFGFSDNVKPFEYDINEAESLLESSQFDKGSSVTLVTSDRQERINMAEVIQSQLKGIGVEVDIQVLEYGAYIEAMDSGEFDMFIGGWGNATGDGDYNQYNLFHTNSFGSAGNHFYYSNPEVDSLIEEARQESDDQRRLEIYEQTQKIELEEDAVYVPIRNSEQMAVSNNDVHNFWLSPTNYIMINEATVE